VSATVGACVPWIWLAYIVVARLSKRTMERYAAIQHREANWRRRMARVRGDEWPSSWRLLMPGWANGLADKIRQAIGARRASVPTNDVIYDDGWTRVYAPCPATDWFAEVEYLRIPWVEEAKARKAAEGAPQDSQQVGAARATPGLTPSTASTQVRHRRPVAVRPSQVVAGDGAWQCAADIIGAACRCGAHLRLDSHGSTADTMTAYCPQCFSLQ
jgi:hypothetical protein